MLYNLHKLISIYLFIIKDYLLIINWIIILSGDFDYFFMLWLCFKYENNWNNEKLWIKIKYLSFVHDISDLLNDLIN